MAEPSPMMAQYQGVRERYPGHLVLFRVGDFFETFGEDAVLLSRELDIVLTSRQNDATGQRIPMAGVPQHALSVYLNRLVHKGHRVVICDQVEDAKVAQGLVRREVTRVVTPGTLLEEALLPRGESNYLASWGGDDERGFAVSLVDISTGETILRTYPAGGILPVIQDIAVLAPAEVLLQRATGKKGAALADAWRNILPGVKVVEGIPAVPVERLPSAWREVAGSSSPASEALGMAAAYIERCESKVLPHLSPPICRHPGEGMMLDVKTLRHLEVTEPMNPLPGRSHTLLDIMNVAESPPGSRTITAWLKAPLADPRAIEERLEAVQTLLDTREALLVLRAKLKNISDLSRLSARVLARRASPRDMRSIGRSLEEALEVRDWIGSGKMPLASPLIARVMNRIGADRELPARLLNSVVEDPPPNALEGGVLRPAAFPRLKEIREREEAARRSIVELERRESETTGIRNLKVGFTQVFGYYFEVTRPHLSKVPQDRWRRKQTLASAERYTSKELEERESALASATQEALTVESGLWEELLTTLDARADLLRTTSDAIGELDALSTFADIARKKLWVRPKVHSGTSIRIREGRHPVLEEVLGPGFVPNDTELDGEDDRLLLLTGPNMAGKSTYMRQVGLIVLLAQCGSFVPAKYAEIGVVDYLATRMGFTDEIGRGKSTFMVEMSEVADILLRCGSRSLVLLDEVGRGTSTSDGLSIAWAIVRYLHDKIRVRTIVATHYHQLASLVESLPAARNAHLGVREEEGEVTFLRVLLPGATNKSYGIHVAELAGLPTQVIKEARKVLLEMEKRTTVPEGPGSGPPSMGTLPRYTQAMLVHDSGADDARRIVEELRAIKLESVTPLEALNHLHRLAGKAAQGEPQREE